MTRQDEFEQGKDHEPKCEASDCGQPATGTTWDSDIHGGPRMRPVPTCDRCHKQYTGKERSRA